VNKSLVPIIVIGAVVGLVIYTSKGQASPEPYYIEIPTVGNIMQSQSVAELNAYYRLVSELYITNKLTQEEYLTLYDAYYERWYELIGVEV